MPKNKLILLITILLIGCGQQSAETNSQSAPVAIADSNPATEMLPDDSAAVNADMINGGNSAESAPNQPPSSSPNIDSSMSTNDSMMDGIKTFVFGDAGDVSFNGIEQNAALSKAARDAVKRAAEEEEIASVLAIFPIWDAEVNEDGDVWWMDFINLDGDWLGWAGVNMADNEVFDYEMAGFKSAEEVSAMLPIIEAVAVADPEIQAIMDSATAGNWYTEAGYDPYEEQYYYYFDKGIENYIATFWIEDNGKVYVESVGDPEALEEAELEQWNQNQAVEIAYEIPDIWERFNNIDDYRTYVSPEGENLYSVSFAHSSGEIVYALVDISTREILDFR